MAIFVLLGLLGEYKSRISPGLFRLPNEQGAYAAVASDAMVRNTDPRAIVVTFWPGNSHETTVFQYYASLYRIRLVNGYRPFVNADYREFYERFSSINQGVLSDLQLDELLKRGVDYVLLHEDRYPEVVSPFPVTFTLRRLLESPRLTLIDRHDEVWAFRILPEPQSRTPIHPDWTLYGASRHWEAERRSQGCDVVSDPTAGRGRYLVMGPDDDIQFDSVGLGPEPRTRCLLRVRGTGSMDAISVFGQSSNEPIRMAVSQTNWGWLDMAIPDRQGFESLRVVLKGVEGGVQVDRAVLTAGEWNWCPAVGEKRLLPAAGFFHAGYFDIKNNTVVFEKGRRTGGLFNGPQLPLACGTYQATLCFRSNAESGVELGQFRVGEGSDEIAIEPVTAGRNTTVRWSQSTDFSFSLTFDYSGQADVEIEGVTLERIE